MIKDIRQYFAAAILLLMPMLLTGCLKNWSYTGCPIDDNLELRFRLVDANGDLFFAEKIKLVDVLLFDEYGSFVMRKAVTGAELSADNSVRLTVAPGTYMIVALGNLGNLSAISSDGPSLAGSYIEVVSSETGEQHYYAPSPVGSARGRALDPDTDYSNYRVVLPPGEVVEKELNFARSNRTVNIYIKGAEYLDTYTGEQAYIEFRNLPYKYDLLGNVDAGRKDYARLTETTVTTAGNMLRTSFSTPLCPITDDMTIHLYDGGSNAGLTDEPINLKLWVEENVPQDINEFDMLVTFTKKGEEVNVSVTLPDWETIGVKPGDL